MKTINQSIDKEIEQVKSRKLTTKKAFCGSIVGDFSKVIQKKEKRENSTLTHEASLGEIKEIIKLTIDYKKAKKKKGIDFVKGLANAN